MKDKIIAEQSRETGASVDELVGLGMVEPLIAQSAITAVIERVKELADDESLAGATPLEIASLVVKGLANITEELSVGKVVEKIQKRQQFSEEMA